MKKRILVVDDEPEITFMVKLNLEQTGRYEVRTENLGRRAIEAAREFRPDLILLDVMMPDMLGSEIAEQLQADPKLRAIKFVFLTAMVTKEGGGLCFWFDMETFFRRQAVQCVFAWWEDPHENHAPP